MRLASEGVCRFEQVDCFGVTYGGREANVVVALVGYGLVTISVTKLPKHEIGRTAALRCFGRDTSCIVCGGERIEIYFLASEPLSIYLT